MKNKEYTYICVYECLSGGKPPLFLRARFIRSIKRRANFVLWSAL